MPQPLLQAEGQHVPRPSARKTLPSRSREGLGVGTVPGIQRPTALARALRRDATPAEIRLWRALSNRKLGHKFSRQMPIGLFVVDFLCRAKMLVIELDSYSHDLTIEHDRQRTAFIEALGFRIVRFATSDVLGNLEGVVRAVCVALGAPTPQPPPASGRGSTPA